MMLTIGLTTYGAALLLTGLARRGLLPVGAGLWLTALVRPHIAGMLGLALGIAYLFRRPKADLRQLAPLGKGIAVALLAAVAIVLVVNTDEFLNDSGIDTTKGISSTLEQTTQRTATGDSQFNPSILESPLMTPVAVATVLYRPFIFEAHNMEALATALEGSFLLALTLIRLRPALRVAKGLRRNPYVVMALAFSAMFIVAFSSFANFGLLARERVQLLPFFLIFLVKPTKVAIDSK